MKLQYGRYVNGTMKYYEVDKTELFSNTFRAADFADHENVKSIQMMKAVDWLFKQYGQLISYDPSWKFSGSSVKEFIDEEGKTHFDIKISLIKPDTEKEVPVEEII